MHTLVIALLGFSNNLPRVANFSVYWNGPTPDDSCNYCDSTYAQSLHTDNEQQAWTKYYSINIGNCNPGGDQMQKSIIGHGTLIGYSTQGGDWQTLLNGQAYFDGALPPLQLPNAYYVCKYNAGDCGNRQFVAITNNPDDAYKVYYEQVEPHGGALIVNGSLKLHSDVAGTTYCSQPQCGALNAIWCLGEYFKTAHFSADARVIIR